MKLMSIDHSWVGLVTCNDVSTEWFACGDNAPTITHGMGCNCPQTSATLAFTAVDSPIQAIMQLGVAYPQSSCFPSFTAYCSGASQGLATSSTVSAAAPNSTAASTPAASRTTSTSLTTNSGGSVITVVTTQLITAPSVTSIHTPPANSSSTTAPGVPSPADSSTSSDAGLKTQAKIGIGVGSAVGAVFAGTLLWYCVSCMRKRKRKSALPTESHTSPVSSDVANGFAENDKLGDDDPRSPTWSGRKSELPAEDSRSPTRSRHKSELPADDHEVKSPVPAYEPYRGSYRSSTTAEVEHSPRYGVQGRADREGLYEMP
jgi:hypothetical protein